MILLKYNVEFIAGTRLVNCSWFCFNAYPDFTMSGIVAKIIKHERGKISKTTATIDIPYAMMGNIHKIEHAFAFQD